MKDDKGFEFDCEIHAVPRVHGNNVVGLKVHGQKYVQERDEVSSSSSSSQSGDWSEEMIAKLSDFDASPDESSVNEEKLLSDLKATSSYPFHQARLEPVTKGLPEASDADTHCNLQHLPITGEKTLVKVLNALIIRSNAPTQSMCCPYHSSSLYLLSALRKIF